jgi:PAS domain S-box-containing protein
MTDQIPAHWDSPIFKLTEKAGGIGVWIYNLDSRLWWFSENLLAMLGISGNARPGSLKDVESLLYPQDTKLLDETVRAVKLGENVPCCELRIVKGHSVRHIRQSTLLLDEDGKSFMVGTWQDISADKEKTEAILFFEKLVDASIDGIMVMDTDLRVLLWNSHNELVKGISRKEVVGRKLMDVQPEIEQSADVSEAIRHALIGFASFVPASHGTTGNGYYEDHYLPLKNNEGDVIAILNIRHDVAHRIKAENELKELNRFLETNNRELKQRTAELQVFSHITSYDFKEPLRRIYTAVEMLVTQESENFSERGKQYFKQVQGAVQRIGLLADDILSYSRLDIQKTVFAEVDLNEVLDLVKKRMDEPINKTNALITRQRAAKV